MSEIMIDLDEFSRLREAELQEYYDPLSKDKIGCHIDAKTNGKIYQSCYGKDCDFVQNHINCEFWITRN